MGRRSNIDWERGRAMHVIHGATYNQVAEALGVSPRSVQRWASRESWPQERARFLATNRALSTAKSAEAISDVAAEEAAETHRQLAQAQRSTLTAVLDALALSHRVITGYQDRTHEVTLQDAATLLRIVLRFLALWSQPPAQPGDTNVTNILVQLQSLGVEGRVAAYRNLTDPDA